MALSSYASHGNIESVRQKDRKSYPHELYTAQIRFHEIKENTSDLSKFEPPVGSKNFW